MTRPAILVALLLLVALPAAATPSAESLLDAIEGTVQKRPDLLIPPLRKEARAVLERFRDRQLRLLSVKYDVLTLLRPSQQTRFQAITDRLRESGLIHPAGHRWRDLARGLEAAERRSGAKRPAAEGSLPPPMPDTEELMEALLRSRLPLGGEQWAELARLTARNLDEHVFDHAVLCALTTSQRHWLVVNAAPPRPAVRRTLHQRARREAVKALGGPRARLDAPPSPARVRWDFVVPEAGYVCADPALAARLALEPAQWKALVPVLWQGMRVEQAIDASTQDLARVVRAMLGPGWQEQLPRPSGELYRSDMTEQVERILGRL